MAETPQRVLLVSPHQDDAEGGCGGTIAKWIKDRAEVIYILCTNGDKGSSDPTMTSERLAIIRELEQQEAADVLGVKEVVNLRYPDGELEDTLEFRGQVVREIRRHKPDVVMCIDPFKSTSHTHRDHRISGMVTLDAIFTYAWSPLHFPEQLRADELQPHQVKEVYLWSSEKPNTYVDISDTVVLKAQSMTKHVSQMKEPEKLQERISSYAQSVGESVGLAYAEGFRHVHLNPGFRHWAELSPLR